MQDRRDVLLEDVAVLKSEMRAVMANIEDIKNYLKNNTEVRHDQHSEIVTKLALIDQKQQAFINYQDSCENDRIVINEKLRDLENTQTIHRRVGSIFIAAITSIGGLLEYVKHWGQP